MTLKLRMIALAAAILPLACGVGTDVLGSAAGTAASENHEIWVTLQASDRIAILHGPEARGARRMIDLPAGTGPHLTTFSPDGKYAYVSGMGNGDLDVIQTGSRRVVNTLHLAPTATHQAKSSPDGSVLLVAQVALKSLIKVSVDEAAQTWQPGAAALSFAAMGKAPICTIFADNGERAFVSLNPDGLAIVDVETMRLRSVLATDGFVACGMVKSTDGRTITLAAGGSGGHLYRLDTATEQLSDLGVLGAVDWHSFNMVPGRTVGFGTVPRGDELRIIDLRGDHASTLAALALNPTPGTANDQPDNMGVTGDFVYVSLRMSGKIAVVNVPKRTVRYVQVAPAAPAINPANCAGCAVHGVAIRG